MRQISLFEAAGNESRTTQSDKRPDNSNSGKSPRACGSDKKPDTATGVFTAPREPKHHTVQNAQRTVVFYPDFNSWWQRAKICLAQNIEPADIWWSADHNSSRVKGLPGAQLHSAFVQEATTASCHHAGDRWALLYSILWRLTHNEPQLLELSGDFEVATLHKYVKAVSRDVHKMKAFVRFRQVPATGHSNNPPRYVAWFEPQHHIIEYAAPFFKRRFSNMHWSILTPVGCAHGDCDDRLWFSDPVDKSVAPDGDQFEDAWRVYYKSIFNPARLKINAMQSEMPKKYWHNLPEAREISSLIESAEQRTRVMIDQKKPVDTYHCGTRPAHPSQLIQQQLQQTDTASLQAVRLQASICTGCPQGASATQTVFGEGPEDAKLMIIGEQPGNEEDLRGKPFVGPAGQLLYAALQHAGIERHQCYLTNAVKHFGFEPRGKKRLHKRLEASVVSSCGHWLEREIEIINPEIIVYLGATAASTRFGPRVRISRDRGRLITRDNRQYLITAHPSGILHISNKADQQQAYVQLVNDLKHCTSHW